METDSNPERVLSFGKSAGGRFSDKNGAAAMPQAVETREARLRPFTSSINGGVPEWPKGADCKSVASRFGGSNPPSSTIKDGKIVLILPYFFDLSNGHEESGLQASALKIGTYGVGI